jgi:glucose-6-phosphate 1-dehydrogenase
MNYHQRSLTSVSSRIIPVQPFDYVVFGATGDLTKRKLIPALFHRFVDGQFDEQSRIIGVSRSKLTDAEFQKTVRDSIEAFVEKAYQDKKAIDRFVSICTYVANDVTDEANWGDLDGSLRKDTSIVRAFYLAIAPDLFGPTCEYIKKKGYYRRDARVVIEKPLGHDLASSIAINDEVSRIFKEDQVYRIDHYLGKETVQNLLALRFANILFEPIWNSAISSTCRSPWRNRWARAPAATTMRAVRCATWCRTTLSSCLPLSPWSPRLRTAPMHCATKS